MFLKACNIDKFLKSSSRHFHSLMEDGIHEFCVIQSKKIRPEIDTIKYHTWPRIPMGK